MCVKRKVNVIYIDQRKKAKVWPSSDTRFAESFAKDLAIEAANVQENNQNQAKKKAQAQAQGEGGGFNVYYQ